MSPNQSNTVTVNILDKEYQVVCPEEERDALRRSASLLHERMRDIRNSGSIMGLERIAVMAALNLCHELLQAQDKSHSDGEHIERLETLNTRLGKTLEQLSG
ncbi:MAG: cell division protein ZapA [Cellvibrionaceae bacterium]